MMDMRMLVSSRMLHHVVWKTGTNISVNCADFIFLTRRVSLLPLAWRQH